jgi:hypothetical protein
MSQLVDDYLKRPARYQFVDGVYEMAIGLMLMALVPLNRLDKSVSYKLISLTWILFIYGAISYGVYALKKRITYPRTGYVRYKRSCANRWIAGLAGFAVAVGVGILFRRFRHAAIVFPFPESMAVFWALLYALMTRIDQGWRWIAILAMIGGPVLVSTSPLEPRWVNALSTGFLGLVVFASGVATFILYLHRTRPPEEVANE